MCRRNAVGLCLINVVFIIVDLNVVGYAQNPSRYIDPNESGVVERQLGRTLIGGERFHSLYNLLTDQLKDEIGISTHQDVELEQAEVMIEEVRQKMRTESIAMESKFQNKSPSNSIDSAKRDLGARHAWDIYRTLEVIDAKLVEILDPDQYERLIVEKLKLCGPVGVLSDPNIANFFDVDEDRLKEFAEKSRLFELEVGKVAVRRARTKSLKGVHDHFEKANEEFAQLANDFLTEEQHDRLNQLLQKHR